MTNYTLELCQNIKQCISSSKNSEVFFEKLEMLFTPKILPTSRLQTIHTLKHYTNDNQYKGNLWELFCIYYILFTNKESSYFEAWSIKEVPENVRAFLKLTHQDCGIDLIVRKGDPTIPNQLQFWAIQCKFRSPKKDRFGRKIHRVTWTELSTFLALTSRTGPFTKQIVITNAESVSWKGKKENEKDQTLARNTFKSLSMDWWVAFYDFVIEKSKTSSSATISIAQNQVSTEEIRNQRKIWLDKLSLKFYNETQN
jgi:hypothetical protein